MILSVNVVFQTTSIVNVQYESYLISPIWRKSSERIKKDT